MARKREQRLWGRTRKNLIERGIHMERIENLVGSGIPDVLFKLVDRPCFMELKAVEAPPKRATTPLLGGDGLRLEQENWHKRWNKTRRNSYILVGVGSKQYLIGGEHSDDVNGFTFDQVKSISLASTWDEIATEFRKSQ